MCGFRDKHWAFAGSQNKHSLALSQWMTVRRGLLKMAHGTQVLYKKKKWFMSHIRISAGCVSEGESKLETKD